MNKKMSLGKKLLGKSEIGILIPLVVICVAIGIVNINFFAIDNILDILRTSSFAFIVAVPLTYLLIAADLDLSVGAVTSLGGVVTAFSLVAGVPVLLAMLFGVLAGVVVGLLKAFIIVKGGLPSFITTLGLMYVVNGFISITTQGMPISGFPDAFKFWGQYRIFGKIHLTVVIALVIGVLFHIILSKTKYGRSIYAIGGNRDTAYLAGIPLKKRQIGIHVLVSAFAALAGVFMASRFASAQPTAGTGTELTIMAAVIIGGTSMFGGSGSILGTVIGCVLFSVINNGLILMRIPSFWQNMIYGLILLISIALDRYRQNINNAG